MKETLSIICIMLLLCAFVVSFLEPSRSDEETYYHPSTTVNVGPDHVFRMGPVLLKFDEEWIFEKNGKKYIRIGIDNRKNYSSSQFQDYENISPKSLASSTKSIEIESEVDYAAKKYSIDSYDIECDKKQLWIDLFFVVETEYEDTDKVIELNLSTGKDIFFYNPTTKKWWGRPYGNMQNIKRLMFTDLYDTTKTVDDLKKLYTSEVLTAKDFVTKVINKRTLNLPSTKYFEEKIRVLQTSSTLYDMYIEKNQEEVTPKNDE